MLYLWISIKWQCIWFLLVDFARVSFQWNAHSQYLTRVCQMWHRNWATEGGGVQKELVVFFLLSRNLFHFALILITKPKQKNVMNWRNSWEKERNRKNNNKQEHTIEPQIFYPHIACVFACLQTEYYCIISHFSAYRRILT